MSYTSQIFFYL